MRKSFFALFFLYLLSPAGTFAQHAVTSTGGDASGSGGTVAFSVGQLDYISTAGTSGAVYQGVQQPYEVFTVGVEVPGSAAFQLSVFPNPASSQVTMRLETPGAPDFLYQLFDLYGRLLLEEPISPGDTHISLHDFRPATYLLKVSGGSEFKIYKIVKNQ